MVRYVERYGRQTKLVTDEVGFDYILRANINEKA